MTITHIELEAEMFGKRRWILTNAANEVARTEKAVKFKDTDENGRVIFWWVPASCCEQVDYVNPTGDIIKAIKFPMKFAKK